MILIPIEHINGPSSSSLVHILIFTIDIFSHLCAGVLSGVLLEVLSGLLWEVLTEELTDVLFGCIV